MFGVIVLAVVLCVHEEDVHIGDVVLHLCAIAVELVCELTCTEVELIVGDAEVIEVFDNSRIVDVLGVVCEFRGHEIDAEHGNEYDEDVGKEAFEGYDKMTKLVMPDTVTTVDFGAFSNCSNRARNTD